MNLIDGLKLEGHLVIEARDFRSGRLIKRIDKKNLICQNSWFSIGKLLSQPSSGDPLEYYRIWAIYVGDSNTAPASSQTGLLGTNTLGVAVTQPISESSNSSGTVLTLEMTLGTGDFNGNVLRECGIFTRGDADTVPPTTPSTSLMLARQVHSDISKSSSMTVKYTWRYRIYA